MEPDLEDLLDGAEAQVALASASSWLETYGAILDKERNLVRAPKCNKLQRNVVEIIEWCAAHGIPCRIVGLKARQVGLSTMSIAAAYHACRKKATNFLLIGDEYEKSVKNLHEMFNRFAETDDFQWGSTYHRPSGKFGNGSAIVTETANDNRAGASGTYQFVAATEVAHWKETAQISAAKVFQAFLACVPKKPGTVVIVESTANGEGNTYHNIYSGAITFEDLKAGRIPEGWNGFVKVFMAWHEFPEYTCKVTQEEAVRILLTLDAREKELLSLFPRTVDPGRLKWRRQTIAGPEFNGNAAKFEEEYPSDEDSAFLSSGGRVFSAPHIRVMGERAGEAVPEFACLDWQGAGNGSRYPALRICPETEAWLKVYERPMPGRRYALICDPMTGRTTGTDPDNHGAALWRYGYRDQVGRWRPRKLAVRITDCGAELAERIKHGKNMAACRWEIDILAQRLALVSEWAGRCIIVPEINMDRGLVPLLQRDGYAIYVQQKYNQRENRQENFYGWDTTPENRGSLITGLSTAIRNLDTDGDGLEVLDPVVVQEYRVFVQLSNGRTEAMGGWHDDNVLMSAIAIAVEESATLYAERKQTVYNDIERIALQQKRLSGRHLDRTLC